MLFARGRGAIRLAGWMYSMLLMLKPKKMLTRRTNISLKRSDGLYPGKGYSRSLARPRDRGLDGRIVGLRGGLRGLRLGGRGVRRCSAGRRSVLR